MPDAPASTASPKLPPVTVLCGFLGAGKTTLLNHLLSQADGRRWAAVVNDVAAVNIDAVVVRTQRGAAGDVVELGNGCVCCSSRDELGETIAQLALTGEYEHILVETTGVAEPRGIAALFVMRNPFGKTLSQFARLSALVSVVESRQFLDEWRRQKASGEISSLKPGQKPVFDLLVEQIECADVLVLNKSDLLNAEEKGEVETLVEGLNPGAERVLTEQSQVASEYLLDRPRFDPARTMKSAAWIQKLNTLAPAAAGPCAVVQRPVASRATPRHEARFGIRSFVFQARRPFSLPKLQAFFAAGQPGLLRAKGFFWTAERPDEMGFLSLAGRNVQYDFLNYWWAALVESGKVKRTDVPPALEPLWQDPAGDRRQELVFIGVNLDEAQLRDALADCLA